MEIKMQELVVERSYAQVNGSLVHLTRYESSKYLQTTGTRRVIVFVPCTMGLNDINHDFIVHLFNNLKQYSLSDVVPMILVIGHNNFQYPISLREIAGDKLVIIDDSNMRLIDRILAKDYESTPNHLDMQVLNKLVILRHLFGKNFEDCEFTFVGHSIGCYIILKLLQDRALLNAHRSSVLIHPSLCDVSETERGTYWVQFFRYKLDILVLFFTIIIENFLPQSFVMFLIRWSCKDEFVDGSSDVVLGSVLRMACYKTIKSTIEMADNALREIKYSKSMTMIQPIIDKLKFIYACNDHWVDPETIPSLRDTYPNVYIEENPVPHAFIMSPRVVKDYAIRVARLIENMSK